MASAHRETVSRELDRVFQHGTLAGLSEGQLLRQFVAGRDEVAFEALVARHGPMVLGVCRRMLGDSHDAADAFQATFLLLVRKAGSLRDADQLGPWLYGVAFKVAARARSSSARRRDRERQEVRSEALEETSVLDQTDLRGILDEELNRLPEKYRRPLILCYVEGQTHEEAARRLRCTTGMLRGRLDRAREKLRGRLARRGLAPSAALAVTALATEAMAEVVPNSLKETTVLAVSRVLVSRAAPAAISASVLSLVDGVLRSTLLSKLKLVTSLLTLGAVFLVALPRVVSRDEKADQVPDTPTKEVRRSQPGPAEGSAPAAAGKGITVEGRVLDREGRPIAGARVGQGTNRQVGATPEAITDDEGRFVFQNVAPGPLILTVQANGRAPDLKSLVAAPGLKPMEFRLGPGRSIGGQLVDLMGKPIAGAPVSAGPWRNHTSLVWHSVTDAVGRYRWNDAPEDEVLIDLGTLGYTSKRYLSFAPSETDRVLTIPRPRFVRGSVTDAETGKPIEQFTVLTGHSGDAEEHLEWEFSKAQAGSGGSYEAKLGAEYRDFLRYVRIEADGYLPERSRAFQEKEAEWDHIFNLKLRRGDGTITGLVRQPDGSPLAGADVVLLTSITPINNDRLPGPERSRVVKTGLDGRFRFPAIDTSFTIVVLDNKGYAERTSKEFAVASELTVRPWGRIEGIYLIGSRPGVGEKLDLMREWKGGQAYYNSWTTTDDTGHFVFERVHPGEVTFAQSVSKGNFRSLNPLSESFKVAPGATVRVTIGGTGRPIIGRLDLQAPLTKVVDWTWSELYVVPAAQGSRRSYVGKSKPDGTFRFEDVPTGAYQLLVILKKTPADSENGLAADPIATARRDIKVSEMPGGRSDEPLDIGEIMLEPTEKR